MTHHITDEQIGQIAEQVGLVGPASRVGDCHAASLRFARALLALAAPAPQVEPYGWAVTGCHSLYRGEWAESTAQAEARRCGGTAVAFPLYTAPAPAVPSDERAAFEAWARPHGYDLRRNAVLGHYSSLDTLRAWEGWQARAALTAAPTPPAQGEKLVRFCPGCGSVGDVPDTFRDCCPDGSNARMIPEDLATRCHDLFLLALDGAKAQQPAVPESADTTPPAQCTNSDTWNCKYCKKASNCAALNDPRNFDQGGHKPQPIVPESAGVASEQVATSLTPTQIDDIINAGGYRNAAGGIYETSVYRFATDIQAAIKNATQPAVPEDVARDAERYRWLREQDNDDFCFAVVKNPHFDVYEPGADLDAAIDAARAAGGAA